VVSEDTGHVFVTETTANRLRRVEIDFETATAHGHDVHADVFYPDNVKLAPDGDLLVASIGGGRVWKISRCPAAKQRLLFKSELLLCSMLLLLLL